MKPHYYYYCYHKSALEAKSDKKGESGSQIGCGLAENVDDLHPHLVSR